MSAKTILLVEDNEDDIALALRAIEANRIANPIVVCRDGEAARDWLFGVGAYEGRDPAEAP